MSATGLAVFDKTLQKSNIWLNEISDEIGPDKQLAYQALKAVLHAVRDRLLADEAVDLAAQMPILIRGVYFDGWNPTGSPNRKRTKKDFLDRVSSELIDARPVDPEDACRAVFMTLSRHITEGELDQVKKALPKPVREIWPDVEDVLSDAATDDEFLETIPLNEEKENIMANNNRNDQSWSRYDRDEDQSRYSGGGSGRYQGTSDYDQDWEGQGAMGNRGWSSDQYESERYSRSGRDNDRDYGGQHWGGYGGQSGGQSGGRSGGGYGGGDYGSRYSGSQGDYQGDYQGGSYGGQSGRYGSSYGGQDSQGGYGRDDNYSRRYSSSSSDQDRSHRGGGNDYDDYNQGQSGRRMAGNRQSYGYEGNSNRRGRY